PHKGGPLSQGIVFGTSVACPLHNWAIGLDDGCAKSPDEGCTPRFAVKLEDGQVMMNVVELKTHAIDLAPPRAGPGAATAGKLGDESFDVQAPHGS
ncbi:MAG TPA: Rieske 2Fe-2S domain-containing protein, partial [Variovorax sp.]|nr:Rieske 2Fe-2S domain-containing protein [Variovorax sp.]